MEEKIVLVLEPDKCPYWNYKDQTYRHTCMGCWNLSEGNSMDTIQCGVMINGNRYCMLECDIYGEIIKTLKKEEEFEKMKRELEFTRQYIHDNGLEWDLMSKFNTQVTENKNNI